MRSLISPLLINAAKDNGADTPAAEPIQRHGPIEADLRGGEGPRLRRHHRKILLRPRRPLRHVRRQRRQQSPGEDEQERRRHLPLPRRPLRQGDRRSQRLGEQIPS